MLPLTTVADTTAADLPIVSDETGLLSIFRPETARVGIIGISTTRGDRLFISRLGSAFINFAWLGLFGPGLWASGLALPLPQRCSAGCEDRPNSRKGQSRNRTNNWINRSGGR